MSLFFRKLFTSFGLVLLAALLCANFADAQKSVAKEFERGEELTYEAEFSRALLKNIDVAEFRFQAVRLPTEERHHAQASDSKQHYLLKFTAEIKSKGFFSKLFNLNFLERVTSLVEPGSFAVKNTKRYDQQGKRVRTSETVYDREQRLIVWTETDPRDPSRQPRVATVPLNDEVQDILSAIYFLRTQPLQVGKTLKISVNDSGNLYEVPVRVVEKKRLKTVLGRVETVRVEADLFGARGMVGSDGQFSIWLTTDERHVPVKARIKHEYGTFDITLKKRVPNASVPAD
jgi:hypothetical protein